MKKTIRPLLENEFEKYVDYFLNLSPEDDQRMGVDRKNLPSKEEWLKILIEDSKKPLQERQYCCLGMLLDDELIGHTNLTKIIYGQEAYIHFHLWSPNSRKRGLGSGYILEAMDYYFNHFSLQKIMVEPKTDNSAPNKVALQFGAKLVDSYRTKPSSLNYEQQVNCYEISKEVFEHKHFETHTSRGFDASLNL